MIFGKGPRRAVFVLWSLLLQLSIVVNLHGVDGIRRCDNVYESLSREGFFAGIAARNSAEHDLGTVENVQLLTRHEQAASLHVPGNINPYKDSKQQQKLTRQWPETRNKKDLKSSDHGHETLSTYVDKINVRLNDDNHNDPAIPNLSSPQMTTPVLTDSSAQKRGSEQLVTISIDLLTSLIKRSRVPPSGPSRDHNWVASSILPEQNSNDRVDSPNNSDTVIFRIHGVDILKDDHIGNELAAQVDPRHQLWR